MLHTNMHMTYTHTDKEQANRSNNWFLEAKTCEPYCTFKHVLIPINTQRIKT